MVNLRGGQFCDDFELHFSFYLSSSLVGGVKSKHIGTLKSDTSR